MATSAMGIIGRNLIQHLSSLPKEEWSVILAVSRRPLDFESRARHLPIDLLNRDEVRRFAEKEFKGVTHVFFAAYQEKPTLAEQVPPNLAMLVNLVDAVEEFSGSLVHVSLPEGTKWYGPHLGPFKTPAKETDPRIMPPNFYYDQEDYLISKVARPGTKWTWSAFRPNPVCGWAHGNPMNLVAAIGVYGSICKELNIPMRFPGSEKAYGILLEVVDVELLADGMVWASTQPQGANKAFNISNGDVFRWRDAWPEIAKFFGLTTGYPQSIPLAALMSDKDVLWAQMQKKYGLQAIPFKDIVSWGFSEFVFNREYDWFADVNKLRRAGFHGQTLDSSDMFVRQLEQLRKLKIIP